MSAFNRCVSLTLALLALIVVHATHAAEQKPAPKVIGALERQGLTGVREFPVGEGLRGFAAIAGQQPVAVYVTADGKAIVGSRIDDEGRRIDADTLQELVAKPMSDAVWSKLESSTWVRDGKKDAPRIVYTFSDPNCPYCNRFWHAARPWVESGKVQLRHVMVGVIKADSSTKAAAILTASDRSAALLENEATFAAGGIAPAARVPADVRRMLDANQELMTELGFHGTPAIVFRDASGLVDRINGMPQGDALGKALGPR